MSYSVLSYRHPLTKLQRGALLLAFLVVGVGVGVRAQTAAYNVIDLGTLGGNASSAFDINAAGQVTGSAFTLTGEEHAAIFANGGVTDLGTLGGAYSRATGINVLGASAGSVNPGGSGFSHAAIFANGSVTDLGTLGGKNSQANGVNASGQAVGYAYLTGDTASHAALFANGSVTDLGTLGGTSSVAYGINATGQAAGYAGYSTSGAAYHAACFANGSVTDLGSLGGANSVAFGINDPGQAVGYAYLTGNGAFHAALFANGSVTDLGTLGGTSSVAYGINASGQVVGDAYTTGNLTNHGFVRAAGGTVTDLNALMLSGSPVSNLQLRGAGNHLNDWGQIVALGTVGSGQTHAVRLDPASPVSSVAGFAQDTKLVAGMNYRRTPAFTNSTGSGTVVQILDGTAGSGGAAAYGTNRDVTETFTGNPSTVPLASDALDLEGAAGDVLVVNLSYSAGNAAALFGREANTRLGWYDGQHWRNAIDGNTGGTALFAGDRAYNPATDFHLGTFGLDTANHAVWAVVNHGGTFGATLDRGVLMALKSASHTGTVMTLTIDGFTGHSYQLQRSATLTDGFTDLANALQTGQTGTVVTLSYDEGSAPPAAAFYRINVLP